MDLKKLIDKKSFITRLSNKLGIETESVRNYFATGNIPTKHKERIEKAYNLKLIKDEEDKKREDLFWKEI